MNPQQEIKKYLGEIKSGVIDPIVPLKTLFEGHSTKQQKLFITAKNETSIIKTSYDALFSYGLLLNFSLIFKIYFNIY